MFIFTQSQKKKKKLWSLILVKIKVPIINIFLNSNKITEIVIDLRIII